MIYVQIRKMNYIIAQINVQLYSIIILKSLFIKYQEDIYFFFNIVFYMYLLMYFVIGLIIILLINCSPHKV